MVSINEEKAEKDKDGKDIKVRYGSLPDVEKLLVASKELEAKLNLKKTDREGIYSYAKKAQARALAARDGAKGVIAGAEADLKNLTTAAALAQTRCKGVQYETAQEAWTRLDE